MKIYLLFIFYVLQLVCSQSTSAVDLFQRILDVENELKSQWGEGLSAHKTKKAAERADFKEKLSRLNAAFQAKAEENNAKFESLMAAKAQKEAETERVKRQFLENIRESFVKFNATEYWVKKAAEKAKKQEDLVQFWKAMNRAKWEAEQNKMEVNTGYINLKHKAMQEYKANVDKLRAQWNAWLAKVNAALKESWEAQMEVRFYLNAQKMMAARKEFDDLKSLMENELMRRETAKEQRKEKSLQRISESEDDIKNKKSELNQLEVDFMLSMKQVSAKRIEINELIDTILTEQANNFWNEKLVSKMQENLDNAALQKVAAGQASSQAAQPVAKASILDQITGVSSWRTATWILLSLSVVLSIALLGLILYTIQQRKHYEELEGVDADASEGTANPQSGVFFDTSKPAAAPGYQAPSASAPAAQYQQ